LLIVLLTWGAFSAIRFLISTFASLDPNVAAAIVAGIVTVTVSVASLLVSRRLENRAQVIKENREKKIPVYEDLLKFMSNLLMANKLGIQVTDKETIEFMSDFTQRFMVWGSDEVVEAFGQFRRTSTVPKELQKPIELMFRYEELILAIRKDLGHGNKDIKRGDILSLFVNDIDNYLRK